MKHPLSREELIAIMLAKFAENKYALAEAKQNFYLVYFSYPYTRSPVLTSAEIMKKVVAIVNTHKNIVPLVPHFMFDALFQFPAGYTHEEIGLWEARIISVCDAFVYDPENSSTGVRWEKVIAHLAGVPIFKIEEVYRNGIQIKAKTKGNNANK
jgi:hypothetical protein